VQLSSSGGAEASSPLARWLFPRSGSGPASASRRASTRLSSATCRRPTFVIAQVVVLRHAVAVHRRTVAVVSQHARIGASVMVGRGYPPPLHDLLRSASADRSRIARDRSSKLPPHAASRGSSGARAIIPQIRDIAHRIGKQNLPPKTLEMPTLPYYLALRDRN
jgi:hypothetical protein